MARQQGEGTTYAQSGPPIFMLTEAQSSRGADVSAFGSAALSSREGGGRFTSGLPFSSVPRLLCASNAPLPSGAQERRKS